MIRKINLRMFDDQITTDLINYNRLAALIQEQLSTEIIQSAVSKSVILSKAKKLANMTSNQTKIPVMDQLPDAFFPDNNNGKKKTTSMGVKPVNMYAAEMAAIAVFKEEAVRDAQQTGLTKEFKERIAEAMGAKFDRTVVTGDDKPDLWPEGIADMCEKAGAVVEESLNTYDDLLGVGGVISKVETSGYRPTAHIADISVKASLRSVKDNSGRPIFLRSMQEAGQYDLDGIPIMFAENETFVGTDIRMVTGDFTKVVYAFRDALEIKAFNTGNVVDAFGVEHNLLQEDKIAFRAVWRIGYALLNPKNRLNRTQSACPFAILKKKAVGEDVRVAPTSEGYTEAQLSAMTIDQIKELAIRNGYDITKSVKAEIIEEFMAQQDAQG